MSAIIKHKVVFAMWMIHNIVQEGRIPDDFRKSTLVPTYHGKDDLVVTGSYIAIKLLERHVSVLPEFCW